MRTFRFALPMRWLIFCLLVGWLTPAAQAGEFPGRFPFKSYGPSEGIPSTPIYCLAQDRDGFLWMGTENGLFRFDGGATRRWGMAEGLGSDWVVSLAPQPDGGLWVGTNQGLVRFKDGRCTKVLLDGKPITEPIYGLAADSAGKVWGIARNHPFRQAGPDTAVLLEDWPKGRTNMVAPGLGPGSMLVLQDGFLAQVNADGTRRAFSKANGLPQVFLETLGQDGAGRIWVAGGRRLFVLETGATVFQDRSSLMPGGLVEVSKTFRDRHGDLWLPTTQGFLILEKGGGHRLLGAAQGLPLTWTRCLFMDREGNAWMVGAGLVKQQGKGHLTLHQEADNLPQGLVWSLARTRSGDLFAGTSDGIGKLGPMGWTTLPGTPGLSWYSLMEDRDGSLLMASRPSGVYRLRPGSPPKPLALPVHDPRVNALLLDQEGRTWLGTATKGAVPLDPREGALGMRPEDWNLDLINVTSLALDPKGNLWASSLQGLFSREKGKWRRFLTQDGLRADALLGVYANPDGSIWVSYDEPAGASRFHRTGETLALDRHIGPEAGLGTAMVFTVHETAGGTLWVNTDRGVYVLQGMESRRFGRGFGLPAEDCTVHSAILDRDGSYWTGTVNGLIRIAPGATSEVLPTPQTRILEAEWLGQRRAFPTAPGTARPDAKGAFEFHFAAPSYLDEASLRYQVRLVGLEDDWRTTNVREARYPALPGGSYRFEARAALGDGPFGLAEGMDFRVRPPWWLAPFAMAAYGAATLLMIYGIIRFRLASLARSKEQLEGVVNLRTRELAQANSNLEEVNAKNLVLIEDLQNALAEVSAIQGLIPICSYCKKIRDDGGAWNQMEQYISSRSKAKFSHGICPECNTKVRREAIKEGLLPPE